MCIGRASVCEICWRTRMAELKERFALADEIGPPELWGEARRRAAAPEAPPRRWNGRPRRAAASSRLPSPSRCSRLPRSSRGTSRIRIEPRPESGACRRSRRRAPRGMDGASAAAGDPTSIRPPPGPAPSCWSGAAARTTSSSTTVSRSTRHLGHGIGCPSGPLAASRMPHSRGRVRSYWCGADGRVDAARRPSRSRRRSRVRPHSGTSGENSHPRRSLPRPRFPCGRVRR